MFSTRTPAAVQRIPWPTDTSKASSTRPEEENVAASKWIGHDTWFMNSSDLPWLIRDNVCVIHIAHSRTIGAEVWVMSDGRAYFVQLYRLDDEESVAEDDTAAGTNATASEAVPSSKASTTSSSSHRPSHQLEEYTYGMSEEVEGALARQDVAWEGTCIHGAHPTLNSVSQGGMDAEPDNSTLDGQRMAEILSADLDRTLVLDSGSQDNGESVAGDLDAGDCATFASLNYKFSLVAVGTQSGAIHLYPIPLTPSSPPPAVVQKMSHWTQTGSVQTMEWTSDGYALAVGWEKGWGVWSVGGRCLASGVGIEDFSFGGSGLTSFKDSFMFGVQALLWLPGNFELLVLSGSGSSSNDRRPGELFCIPFAKSAVTGQQTPDNTRYAFLQMDDKVMVYRGADQPDMSVINPESDVWQHIKIPSSYIAANWPIRYACISADGRLIAVAGRRGLIHYSMASGRWKLFQDVGQEQALVVRGGLVWFHHVLIAGVEASRSHQVRLYSRDLELANMNVLHRELFPTAVILLSLVDNSLLVYTADNTLYHYLVMPTEDSIKLHLCGSISFDGVVAVPNLVRGMSWMIPAAQKQFGDPADDMVVATILLLVGGKLVLLRPRKAGAHELKYDMQILADRIEFCWIHLSGIGTLENSLWGYDGKGIRVWLDALTIEGGAVSQTREIYDSVKENVFIPLDFYPLSVLMDKGIIIGVEHEALTRGSLPFAMFKIFSSTHLFVHHVLRYHLTRGQIREAVLFASHYQGLVYFSHALEILLHTVVEAEADFEADAISSNADSGGLSRMGTLPTVIEFLDHFDESLEVVVGCARKTEMVRWKRLFGIVGSPQTLFETCLNSGLLKTAGSYLLVLHNLEEQHEDGVETSTHANAVRLLQKAAAAQDWVLCQEMLRFLHSTDDSGDALRDALKESGVLQKLESRS
ncbi:hypothetical protein FS837_012000 [Tulasnella sp. UAMH 9824]|nr:hypothetical protein FS837_012000 [Tulasnella sp. UAMH 9824]